MISINVTSKRFEEIFGKKKLETGRFKWNGKKFVKISDRAFIPERLGFKEPYYDVGLGEPVLSESHKRDLLKRNNLRVKEKGEKDLRDTRFQKNKGLLTEFLRNTIT